MFATAVRTTSTLKQLFYLFYTIFNIRPGFWSRIQPSAINSIKIALVIRPDLVNIHLFTSYEENRANHLYKIKISISQYKYHLFGFIKHFFRRTIPPQHYYKTIYTLRYRKKIPDLIAGRGFASCELGCYKNSFIRT